MRVTDSDGQTYGPIDTGQKPGALRELLSRPIKGESDPTCSHCNHTVKLNQIVRSPHRDLGCVYCYKSTEVS